MLLRSKGGLGCGKGLGGQGVLGGWKRRLVLGLRWQQAGFAKHYHARLPLNIGLGIRVRSHAVQLAHEASLASASGSMVGVAKASLMLYQH